jgi:tetratricopeptide (TPR) repeat protein
MQSRNTKKQFCFKLPFASWVHLFVISLTYIESDTQKEDSEAVEPDELFSWLSPSFWEVKSRREILETRRKTGSLQWVPEIEELKTWKTEADSESRVLWLNGLPGIGKSTIAAFLIQTVETMYPNAVVLHFFCDRKPGLNRVSDIIRTFAYQLLLSKKIPAVRNRLETLRKGKFDITQSSTSLFAELIQAPCTSLGLAVPLYIFIDDLDKCQSDTVSGYSELSEILSLLSKLPNSHLLVTSTPSLSIPLLAKASRQILRDETSIDIAEYVRSEVQNSEKLQKTFKAIGEDPVTYLTLRANGMFRWVVLILFLAEKAASQTLEDFIHALESLPKDLEEVYKKILDGVKNYDLVKEALMWILGSERVFTTAEVRSAMEVGGRTIVLDFREGFLQSDIGSLIQITKSSTGAPTVRLIHDTLRDFFTSSIHAKGNRFHISESWMHSQITVQSLRHLSSCSSANSFSKYAVHYWMEHFRRVESSSEHLWLVAKEVYSFLRGDGLKNWIQLEYDENKFGLTFQIGFLHRVVNRLYLSMQQSQPPTPCSEEDEELFKVIRRLRMSELYELIAKAAAKVWLYNDLGWQWFGSAGELAIQCLRVMDESLANPNFNWLHWYSQAEYQNFLPSSKEEIHGLAAVAGFDESTASAICLSNLAAALTWFNKNSNEAATLLEKSIKQEPLNVHYRTRMGAILESQGRHDEAIKYYDEAKDLDTTRKTCATFCFWQLKANASKENGDLEATIAIYNLAIADDPKTSSMYYLDQAAAYRLNGNYEGAQKVYRYAIQHDPESSADYWINMAEMYAEEGEWEKTINTYLEALKDVEEDQQHVIRDAWLELATSLHEEENYETAKMLLEVAVEANRKDTIYMGRPEKQEFLEQLGMEYLCLAEWDTAITVYKTLIESNYCLTEWEQGIREFSLNSYHWLLGTAYFGAGKLSEAESCFSRNGGTHEVVEVYVRQGQWEAAKTQCQQDLYTVPLEDPEWTGEVWFDLGWLLEREGEGDAACHCYQKAADYFNEALETCEQPDNGRFRPPLDFANIMWSLGLALEKLGCNSAEKLFESAVTFAEGHDNVLEDIRHDLSRGKGEDGCILVPTWLERKEKARRRVRYSRRGFYGRWEKSPDQGSKNWKAKRLEKDGKRLEDVSRPLRST